MKKQGFLIKKCSTLYNNNKIKVTHYGKDLIAASDCSSWVPDSTRVTKSLEKHSKSLDVKKLLYKKLPLNIRRLNSATYNSFSKKA